MTVSPTYKLYSIPVKTTFMAWCLCSYLVHGVYMVLTKGSGPGSSVKTSSHSTSSRRRNTLFSHSPGSGKTVAIEKYAYRGTSRAPPVVLHATFPQTKSLDELTHVLHTWQVPHQKQGSEVLPAVRASSRQAGL